MRENKAEKSRQIQDATEKFLKAGNNIRFCYPGETGEKDMDFAGRQRLETNKRPVELEGKRFGSLLVLRRITEGALAGYWECRCGCGAVVTAERQSLMKGKRTRCDKCAKRASVETKRKKAKGEA